MAATGYVVPRSKIGLGRQVECIVTIPLKENDATRGIMVGPTPLAHVNVMKNFRYANWMGRQIVEKGKPQKISSIEIDYPENCDVFNNTFIVGSNHRFGGIGLNVYGISKTKL